MFQIEIFTPWPYTLTYCFGILDRLYTHQAPTGALVISSFIKRCDKEMNRRTVRGIGVSLLRPSPLDILKSPGKFGKPDEVLKL